MEGRFVSIASISVVGVLCPLVPAMLQVHTSVQIGHGATTETSDWSFLFWTLSGD